MNLKIEITIDTGNAAFYCGDEYQPAPEVYRIIKAIRWSELIEDGGSAALRDYNGNKVGNVEVFTVEGGD